MALITLQQAQLAFGHVALLDRADFTLEEGERVGLIGRNGTGKSSLLKILDGRVQADDGTLMIQNGIRIVTVEQEPEFNESDTVAQAVASGAVVGLDALQEYQDLLVKIETGSTGPEHDADLMRLGQLQTDLEVHDVWTLSTRVDALLSRLSLDSASTMSVLSGGTRKRVALARALLSKPDVLLLDEPTNHLDFESILWLEDLLNGFAGSIVFITHDRHFLDRVATRIIELDRGKLVSFPGNFTQYLTRKEELLESERLEQARFDKFLAQEEVWIRKGVEARRTRSVGRVKRLESMRVERAERREVMGKVKLDIAEGARSGKLVAELTNVHHAFADKVIVNDYSTIVMRGDRIGLIGPNGVGKTTLLKIILGQLIPDAGQVRLGTNIEVAYFDQMRDQLNPEMSLADVISPGSEWIEINQQRKHVMSYLGDFLFAPERAQSPVKSLSGGERARLLLARLFARPANVLVLDEPTNDLDIETLELLEELLQDYPGTVFLVSHDRAFLDNVVTQTIAYESAGLWRDYVGGYEDWLRCRPEVSIPKPDTSPAPSPTKPQDSGAKPAGEGTAKPIKVQRLSSWELKELEQLPGQLEQLELKQAQLNERLADGQLFVQNNEEAQQVLAEIAQIDEQLLEKMERWEQLEQRHQAT